jgi:phosphoribosylaminoimidazole-succinocarboxamide synthase
VASHSVPVLETQLADLPVCRGKVRDIYDLGDPLLLVSTDRISVFDWVLPTGIPDKGRVLTQISVFWFEHLDGSGWREYQQTGEVCGIRLPAGLQQGAQLAGPIFTAATKEETGHDINIAFEKMVEIVQQTRDKYIEAYEIVTGQTFAWK